MGSRGQTAASDETCSAMRSAWAHRRSLAPLDPLVDAVVVWAVEKCGGDDRIAEVLPLFRKAPVGGEDFRAFFVPRVDQPEEEIAAAFHNREVAYFIDDQQRALVARCAGPD